jgi:single-strand DNA-binding protein
MSVNKVLLIGFVGQEVKVNTFDNGDKLASFSLATTDKAFTSKTGQEVPGKTEWHNITATRGLAKLAEMYIQKGSKVYIEGKLKYRSWEKDGIKHYSTEIVAESIELLDRKTEIPS